MTDPYTPDCGLKGKLKRIAARMFAVTPLTFNRPKTLVSFSFDDFPKSAAEAGAEVLEDHGWRATYYASGGFAGGETHFGKMFDSGDLMRLHERGHEIACHTFNHPDASKLCVEASRQECRSNRAFLKAAGHDRDLKTFAFPYGETKPLTKRALLSEYAALRGVRPGINRTGSDRGLLNAVALDGGKKGLEAALDWIEKAKAQPGWLIFFGHDVRDTPSEWGCNRAFLQTVCDAVKSAGFDVAPMGQAIEALEHTR